MTPLHTLELPWKLLITLFLIVLSSGFVVSEMYLMHTTKVSADKSEFVGLDDITLTFYGDPKGTRLKHMVLGPMKKYFSDDEAETLKPAEQHDLDAVVAWSDNKAPELEYWDPKEKAEKPAQIFNIFYTHNCFNCHAPDATMKGNKKDSPLDTYAGVSKFTKPNTGMDKGRLLMLSHVHLLGMGMMFLLAGAAVAMSVWPKWIRCALIVGGLSSILFDIFGWWAVKYGGGAWSPVVMLGGAMMAASFGGSVFVAMYDLWIRKTPAESTV
jgi:hypothetical protein